jgi:hypothetical protein
MSEKTKAYRFLVGIAVGIAVGVATGQLAVWTAVGAGLGASLSGVRRCAPFSRNNQQEVPQVRS